MRVCPKCGFIDSLIWKHGFPERHIDYARIEDFEREHPHIKLKKGQRHCEGMHVYRRTKRTGLYVERQNLLENPEAMTRRTIKFEWHKPSHGNKWKFPTQTNWRKAKESQTKLAEWNGEDESHATDQVQTTQGTAKLSQQQR